MIISREKVLVNKKIILKDSFEVKNEDFVEILQDDLENYVSRSALKLKYFLEENPINISQKICLDIGSSTGGFTQILLENNAKKVFAIDVGTSQLHEKLRNNSKIISLENLDIRNFETSEKFEIIVCDASFISLNLILPKIKELSEKNAEIILLFKPQFEVENKYLSKKGVVKDEKIIKAKLENFLQNAKNIGFEIVKISESKLHGENGNIEKLVWFR